jgi:hypothetical protein
MADDTVTHNLDNMDEFDFTGWNPGRASSLATTPMTSRRGAWAAPDAWHT